MVLDVSDRREYPNPKDLEHLVYLKLPFDDAQVLPDMSVVDGVVQALAGAWKEGRRVLIHCSWGLNRSGGTSRRAT